MVELDFFRDHGLGFREKQLPCPLHGGSRWLRTFGDLNHKPQGMRSVCSPMDLHAVVGGPFREHREQLVQVFNDVASHGMGAPSPLLPIRQRCEGTCAPTGTPLRVGVQRRLQLRVGYGRPDVSPKSAPAHPFSMGSLSWRHVQFRHVSNMGEHLRNVPHPLLPPRPLQAALDVQQAARIAYHHRVRPRALEVRDLALQHLGR